MSTSPATCPTPRPRTRSSPRASIWRGRACSRWRGRSSSTSRAPTPTSRRAITPRCSPRRAATAWCRPSRPCWSCASRSSTSTRCPSSKTSSTAAPGAPISSPTARFKLLVCFGLARDQPLRTVRPAAVRLVPLPGAGSHRRTGRLAVDRPHPAAQHHPARQRRRPSSSASRCTTTPSANGAIPKARSVAKYDLAVLYDPNEKTRAVLRRLDQAFRPHRREDVGRRRADHQAAARRACRI